jgi:hypothetical protein
MKAFWNLVKARKIIYRWLRNEVVKKSRGRTSATMASWRQAKVLVVRKVVLNWICRSNLECPISIYLVVSRSPTALINTKDRRLNSLPIAYLIPNLRYLKIKRNPAKKQVQDIRWLPVVGSRSSKALRRGRTSPPSIRLRSSTVSQRTCRRQRAQISTKLSNLDAILVIARMLSNRKNAQFSEW